ncbi:CRIB DOMAIN-CONTAINING PROTEIN RIC2 [Salix purpurea]|uniref:CRIB DOMAIN-CONTAINING PROTEIN RIC2 n=1 Tax=Salix purpurea TaxID=77065 RepID=A0A9Q0P2H7_SALPP|nr:CRIB DOMAIN-CONTAINING PROTEIN RIC2 [Salix purpurea]
MLLTPPLVRNAVYREEDEEREMEIGYPTDVKHLAHIGLDGTTTTNPIKGWESLKSPEIISFPSFSLRQFELAMAAQAHAPLAELDHSKLV